MAGCAFSCASRSQASPILTLRRFQKNGEVPNFQEATRKGVGLSCRPRGYDLLRCPRRCPRRFNPLRRFRYRHHVGRLTRASFVQINIVLCVSGLENLFPGGAPLFVAHFTLALRRVLEDQGRITILSRCCPGSTTFSPLLHGLSDCLHATSCTSAMIGAYALRSSLLPMV